MSIVSAGGLSASEILIDSIENIAPLVIMTTRASYSDIDLLIHAIREKYAITESIDIIEVFNLCVDKIGDTKICGAILGGAVGNLVETCRARPCTIEVKIVIPDVGKNKGVVVE